MSLLPKGFVSLVRRVRARFLTRRASVALIYGLSAPLLIGAAGLSVDVGYWYQTQTSLQSAADAAAMAAAQGAVAYGITSSADTTTFGTGGGGTLALAAANQATNNQFNFTSSGASTVTVSGTYSSASTTSATSSWTATVTSPRSDFFSKVRGLGLSGEASGTQTATATVNAAETLKVTNSNPNPNECTSGTCQCLDIGGGISVSGGSKVTGTNCGIYGGGTLSASGSGAIMGSSVATGQGSVSEPTKGQGGTYIGTTTSNPSNNSALNAASVTVNQAAPNDSLSALGTAPTTWPTMPAPPTSVPALPTLPTSFTAPTFPSWTAPALTTTQALNFGWGAASSSPALSSSSRGWGCYNGSSATSGQGQYCLVSQGSFTGSGCGSSYVTGLTLGYGSSDGTTYIAGGVGASNAGVTMTMNGDNYYITGGLCLNAGSIAINTGSVGSDVMEVYGGTNLSIASGSSTTFPTGSYMFSGASSATGSATTTGLALTSNYGNGGGTFTIPSASGTSPALSVFGGLSIAANVNLNQGLYYFWGQGTATNSTSNAVTATNGNITVTSGSTLYSGGDFAVSGGSEAVSLGTGNYYFWGRGSVTAPASGAFSMTGSNDTFTLASGSNLYVDGTFTTGNNGQTITLGQGTYDFYGPSSTGTSFGNASYWGVHTDSSGTVNLSIAGTAASPSTVNMLGGISGTGTWSFGAGTFTLLGGTNSCSDGVTFASASVCDLNNVAFTTNGTSASDYYFIGGVGFANGSISMGPGTYELYHDTTPNTPTGWAFVPNASSTFTLLGNPVYISGGIDDSNYSPTISLGEGLYEINTFSTNYNSTCNSSSCSVGAMYQGQGRVWFGATASGTCPSDASGPNTYFVNGGITLTGGVTSVNFCPGIYYITNGNLIVGSGSTVNATSVTFVLESGGFMIDGGSTLHISAPTTTSEAACVDPSIYPESAYDGVNYPYDGTNGYGICGVAIYQARGDTTPDDIVEGGSSSISGAIYTPNAALTLSGAGALTVTSVGYSSVTAASVTVSGSGSITLTETAGTIYNSGGSGGSGGSSGGGGTGTGGTSGSGSGSTTTISSAVYLLVG